MSLIKWDIYRKTYCKDFLDVPKEISNNLELIDLKFLCGFCERNKSEHHSYGVNCEGCEFGKIAGKCIDDEDSLFSKWVNEEDPIIQLEDAEKIYQTIKDLKND